MITTLATIIIIQTKIKVATVIAKINRKLTILLRQSTLICMINTIKTASCTTVLNATIVRKLSIKVIKETAFLLTEKLITTRLKTFILLIIGETART